MRQRLLPALVLMCCLTRTAMGFSFTAPVYLPAFTFPATIVTGELNGDARADIIVTNRDSQQLFVYLSNGTSWNPPVDIGGVVSAVPVTITDLSLADLDGDHDLDLVVCSHDGAAADGLRLLLNNGVGGFSLHQFLPIAGARVAHAADLQHDGWLDVVVLSSVSNTSFLQDAYGDAAGGYAVANVNNVACTFSAVRPIAGLFGPTDVVGFAGLGVVSGAATDEVITVSRLASLGFRRTLFPLVSGAANATSLLLADVNRDGAQDAILRYGSTPAVADEFLGDPIQGFRAAPFVSLTSTFAWSAEAGDLDMDGYPDILLATASPTLQFFKGNGQGGFAAAGSLPGRATTRAIAIADLNGDLTPDVVTVSDSGSVATRVLGIRLNLAPSPLAAPPDLLRWSWSASPNPAHGRFTLRLTLPQDERDLMIDIHDVAGRRVRTLHHGALAAGAHRFEWDPSSDGLPDAPGVYLASVRGSTGEHTIRMVKF